MKNSHHWYEKLAGQVFFTELRSSRMQGTGIRRMLEDARKHKCPEPKFTVNGFFTATFWSNIEIARKVTGQVTELVSEQVGEQVGTKLALSRHQVHQTAGGIRASGNDYSRQAAKLKAALQNDRSWT
jgi:predicted HTH transcriptional regulator